MMTRVSVCAMIALCACGAALAGPISPPAGPVSPTIGPEPRIAINPSNTRGDADSVFKIVAPGSYYLTENITGAVGKSGIEIDSDGVTIDLNGFDVIGVVGSLDGIGTSINTLRNVTILNGSIRDWGNDGVRLSMTIGSRVEGVIASENGHYGIAVGSAGVVARCSARGNLVHGIVTGVGCSVSESVASNNLLNGISAGTGCTISACSASGNVYNGVTTGSDCLVTGCNSSSNGLRGILVSVRCAVVSCIANNNGFDGIQCSTGALISSNNCSANGKSTGDGAGVRATGADNRIEGNNCTGADRGVAVDAAGNLITGNTCSGNTTNWEIAANNMVGPIVASPTSAAISGDTGGAGLGSTNPWANFTY